MKVHDREQKIVISVLLGLLLYIFYPFLPAIFMGGVLAVILYPLHRHLQGKRMKPATVAGVLTGGVTLLVLLPLALLIYVGAKTATQQVPVLMNALANGSFTPGDPSHSISLTGVRSFLESNFNLDSNQFQSSASEIAKAVGMKLGNIFGTIVSEIPDLALAFVLTILSLAFFLWNGPRLNLIVQRHSPYNEGDTRQLLTSFRNISQALVLATLVIGLSQSVIFTVACASIGYKNLPLIGFLIFLMSFIPVVGSAPMTFAIVVFQFATGSLTGGIVLLIAALIASTIDNFVRPLFLRSGAAINPILAIVSVIGGLKAFGFPGVFMGPIIAGILIESYSLHYETKESDSTPLDTADS